MRWNFRFFRPYTKKAEVINMIQQNPQLLHRRNRTNPRGWLVWTGATLVTATSVGIGVQVFRAANDNQEHSIFFPVYLSLGWPRIRRYSYPDFLQYLDQDLYHHATRPGSTDHFLNTSVRSEALDCIFRLPAIRDLFGVPLWASDPENCKIWVELKHLTVQGPQLLIQKPLYGDVKWRTSWNWAVHSLNPASWKDVVDEVGFKLETMGGELDAQNFEVGLCRDRTKRDYDVFFEGEMRLCSSLESVSGSVYYRGHVDFAHLGINGGAKITELVVTCDKTSTRYKVV